MDLYYRHIWTICGKVLIVFAMSVGRRMKKTSTFLLPAHLSCAINLIFWVTWIQLPMTHYYISLFFFKVIIAYWFSFVSFVKVREGILFLTSPNLCIYVWCQISGWRDFPKHVVCPLMSNITTLQQPLYNLTTHPVILQFHHHFMPFFCSIWALKW